MEKIIFNKETICYKVNYYPKYSKDILIRKSYELINEYAEVSYGGYEITNEFLLYFNDIIENGKEVCIQLMKENNLNFKQIAVWDTKNGLSLIQIKFYDSKTLKCKK